VRSLFKIPIEFDFSACVETAAVEGGGRLPVEAGAGGEKKGESPRGGSPKMWQQAPLMLAGPGPAAIDPPKDGVGQEAVDVTDVAEDLGSMKFGK
jgi:hypothetical protein